MPCCIVGNFISFIISNMHYHSVPFKVFVFPVTAFCQSGTLRGMETDGRLTRGMHFGYFANEADNTLILFRYKADIC